MYQLENAIFVWPNSLRSHAHGYTEMKLYTSLLTSGIRFYFFCSHWKVSKVNIHSFCNAYSKCDNCCFANYPTGTL